MSQMYCEGGVADVPAASQENQLRQRNFLYSGFGHHSEGIKSSCFELKPNL
jgi:hypothetical protein